MNQPLMFAGCFMAFILLWWSLAIISHVSAFFQPYYLPSNTPRISLCLVDPGWSPKMAWVPGSSHLSCQGGFFVVPPKIWPSGDQNQIWQLELPKIDEFWCLNIIVMVIGFSTKLCYHISGSQQSVNKHVNQTTKPFATSARCRSLQPLWALAGPVSASKTPACAAMGLKKNENDGPICAMDDKGWPMVIHIVIEHMVPMLICQPMIFWQCFDFKQLLYGKMCEIW